jgi:hypothetical protein
MESEPKLELESKRSSSHKMRHAKVEALSDDEEVITVRAPIAQLIDQLMGNA